MTYVPKQVLGTDAFGRTRVAEPETLFDSKQIFDNLPLLFDDQEVSGGSTTSTHSTDTASTVMGVAATTAGNHTRQTFRAFNYQPGKSQLVFMTGNLGLSGGGSGIESGMGYIDDENGVSFVYKDGTIYFRKRSKITGSVVDTDVAQSAWNMDKMDGTGSSGKTLDIAKAQIFMVDFEWLAVGCISFCFVIDGEPIIAHQMVHANESTTAYTSTPNLPLRWWIENDGTGAASTMSHICGTVISEGGHNPRGIPQYHSTGGTHVDANTADLVYAVVGIRIKSAISGAAMELMLISLIAETNDDFEWLIIHNPTVAGTFTYSDKTNSVMQTASGATANTVTGGHVIDGGFSKQSGNIAVELKSSISLGKAIDGTQDTVVLCVRPLSSNADFQGGMTWVEF